MLTQLLKQQAHDLGFTLAGACAAVTPQGISRFWEWPDRGYGGEMHYLENRREAYAHPSSVLDGVKSLVLLAMDYRVGEARPAAAGQARISRYAWGDVDYHDLIHTRLKGLQSWLAATFPDVRSRGVVDTAPLLEREFAQLAGLGWVGKNTLLLNRDHGSWFFLAALLLDVELEYDDPFLDDHCGTCTACIDACPTRAFPQPYVLDATRCISYLTIELRSDVPEALREGIGDWLFGCDVCQDVCPWNHHPTPLDEPHFAPQPDLNPVDLLPLLDLDEASFRSRFRHTPLWRAKRRGVLRNAAIVLGNQRYEPGRERLIRLSRDDDEVVRTASRWALGQLENSSNHTGDGAPPQDFD